MAAFASTTTTSSSSSSGSASRSGEEEKYVIRVAKRVDPSMEDDPTAASSTMRDSHLSSMSSVHKSGGILKVKTQDESLVLIGTSQAVIKTTAHPTEEASEVDVDEVDANLSVSFGTLEIREFPVTLGDNPSVQGYGCPLSIEWQPQACFCMDLETYEQARTGRRYKEQLQVPSHVRQARLEQAGFSRRMLTEHHKRVVGPLQKSRQQTSQEPAVLQTAKYWVERSTRATLNATVHRQRKARERKVYREPFVVASVVKAQT